MIRMRLMNWNMKLMTLFRT